MGSFLNRYIMYKVLPSPVAILIDFEKRTNKIFSQYEC